jgi:hypothetical protein
MAGIATFDDWIDLFYKWRQDIGLEHSQVKDYHRGSSEHSPRTIVVGSGTEIVRGSSPWLRLGLRSYGVHPRGYAQGVLSFDLPVVRGKGIFHLRGDPGDAIETIPLGSAAVSSG